MTGSGVPGAAPRGRARVAWMIGLLSLTAGAGVVLLAIGAVLDPGLNAFTLRSSLVWAPIGPHLVVLSLVALALALISGRHGARAMARVAAVIASVALAASAAITGRIAWTIHAAGGAVDPLAAILVSPIALGGPDRRETYTTVEGVPLAISIYDAAPRGRGPAPVFLYIHGGGWVSGTADGMAAYARWFADHGWLVLSVEYRLATAERPTWDKAPADVACALVWAAANAARLGGDATHIVVFGESAGGNLAINLAYAAVTGEARSGCGGEVPMPAAAVAVYPVVDPQAAYDHPVPSSIASPKAFITAYLGGTPQAYPDRMRAISSATYLSGKAPRTLILAPERDVLIPPAGVYRFVEQARAAGVDVTLVRMPFANHGFDMSGLIRLPAANSLGNQSRSIILNYLGRPQ
jgi:acetyl esterase